jgi:hypothetical protein
MLDDSSLYTCILNGRARVYAIWGSVDEFRGNYAQCAYNNSSGTNIVDENKYYSTESGGIAVVDLLI